MAILNLYNNKYIKVNSFKEESGLVMYEVAEYSSKVSRVSIKKKLSQVAKSSELTDNKLAELNDSIGYEDEIAMLNSYKYDLKLLEYSISKGYNYTPSTDADYINYIKTVGYKDEWVECSESPSTRVYTYSKDDKLPEDITISDIYDDIRFKLNNNVLNV